MILRRCGAGYCRLGLLSATGHCQDLLGRPSLGRRYTLPHRPRDLTGFGKFSPVGQGVRYPQSVHLGPSSPGQSIAVATGGPQSLSKQAMAICRPSEIPWHARIPELIPWLLAALLSPRRDCLSVSDSIEPQDELARKSHPRPSSSFSQEWP